MEIAKQNNPLKVLVIGYFLIAAIGFIFLCCPWMQKVHSGALDNLFISASAISTTGLTTISVADNYNFLGQLIVLILIQVGGLHYMTFGSIIMLARRKRLSRNQETLLRNDFGLPDNFKVYTFFRSVVVFSLTVEFIGAVILYYVFTKHGVEHPLWQAVFHSISAFCTAGFSLFNVSFENYASDPMLNISIFMLSFLGAIGFIVANDYFYMLTGKKKTTTLTTKIILLFTISVILIGAALLFITDSFPGVSSFASRAWMSIFQSMTSLTTVGFDTFQISNMAHGSVFLLLILMLIGASPAGTGGGIKSTTIVAVFAQMIATLRGKTNVTCMGYQIPAYRLRLANANLAFYLILLSIGIYAMSLVDTHAIFEIIFEAASALGTVGLSMGITSSLTALGKIVIILLMMLGRVGPLAIGMALLQRNDGVDDLGWHEDVLI